MAPHPEDNGVRFPDPQMPCHPRQNNRMGYQAIPGGVGYLISWLSADIWVFCSGTRSCWSLLEYKYIEHSWAKTDIQDGHAPGKDKEF